MSLPKDLKAIDYHGFKILQSESAALGAYFLNTIATRINNKMATNIIFTGEPGIGKSYMAITTARIVEGRYKTSTGEMKDRFKIDQVVFTFSEFMDLVLKLKSGKIIVFDEPSYALGKREWYKELNRALTKTIESFRFKVHPLFIPVVNKSLLDKTVRDHLIQFQVNVTNRGKARVYRLKSSQFLDKTYAHNFCDVDYRVMDMEECKKTNGEEKRDSCLGCKQIEICQVFRAQYERKKREIQDARYEQAKDDALKKESSELTEKQIEEMLLPDIQEIISDRTERISVGKMRVYLRRQEPPVILSTWKAYQIKASIESAHPELFEES